jgi:hypothetical protein
MNRIAAILVGLLVAALALRFIADLLKPALPLLFGLAALGLLARWLFVRRDDRW